MNVISAFNLNNSADWQITNLFNPFCLHYGQLCIKSIFGISKDNRMLLFLTLSIWGATFHRGSVRPSHSAALASNPAFAAKFVDSRDREKESNPSSAHAKDFANAVQQRPELSATKKLFLSDSFSLLHSK